MKRGRKVEVTIDIHERMLLWTTRGQFSRCEQCAGQMVTTEVAVVASGHSSRAIHLLTETGWVHFTDTPAGSRLICLNSLLQLKG